MTGDKTLRCYTVPLLLILCYLFQKSNLFDPLQGFRLSSRMADAVRAEPNRKTRKRHSVTGETVWCGTPLAPSPEKLLHALLNRTFTAMHC
jgi:hypothetical protein